MESVISLYEKPMSLRWENAKTTQKPEVLELMLTDIEVISIFDSFDHDA